MSSRMNDGRSERLRRLFGQVLSGKQTITNATNAKLFLEAIPNESDAAICIQRLMSHSKGSSALQAALRYDISYSFLNGPVTGFLLYLQNPELKSICGGDILRQIVSMAVNQMSFWNAFVEAAKSNHLSEEGDDGFSWLLFQLLSLPMDRALMYTKVVPKAYIHDRLCQSPKLHVRNRAHRMIHIIEMMTSNHQPDFDGPGGRHDNDFPDIKDISILPTSDELDSKEPFLRRAAEVDEAMSKSPNLAMHIDNQFRLLREDMLRDLREEIQIALTSSKKKNRRGRRLDHLSLVGVVCDGRQELSLCFQCSDELSEFKGKDPSIRKKVLKDNSSLFKHQSVTCVIADGEILTLAVLIRNIDLLVESPAILCLRISEAAIPKVLMKTRSTRNLGIVQLSTAIFSHEPVLKQLKEIREISLEESILCNDLSVALKTASYKHSPKISSLVNRLRNDHSVDLQDVLRLPKPTMLDKAQAKSFRAGLARRLSIIQGPPGTGKSFIGSLVLKAIYAHSLETILVVCYTHHALDQFLEDAMNLGVPESHIVRLGSSVKASARAKHLSIIDLRRTVKLNQDQWSIRKDLERTILDESRALQDAFNDFQTAQTNQHELLEYLVFEDLPFYEAFQIPAEEYGMIRVGRNGKAVDDFYLIDRWCRCEDAGIYNESIGNEFRQVWQMVPEKRMQKLDKWTTDILKERVSRVCDLGIAYKNSLDRINSINMERDLQTMRDKRIIACTTTAAAKYVKAIQSIAPGVVIVEEAGEILESHILTALGPETKQLVLIGDHKQLRPKVHHDLSVEKGDGYDLNRSLFERLVTKGYPHHTLSQQHRMRPQFSKYPRKLTYPELVDADDTIGRPELRGLQSNMIFVNHHKAEIEMSHVPEWKDFGSNSSKRNVFEADMTLKCVRYLGQQGYGTDQLVVLTPYLGQLRLLLDKLRESTDPVLNDLDSYDLVRAGLMPAATASLQKPKIRLSTIDNYQGEESDIVIVSLTRSNDRGDIGFMSVPERLNVMITRQRDGLIIIGNAETFLDSRKGKELWGKYLDMLKQDCHIYEGLPVKCERHPNRTAILACPDDFDKKCPDGGCSEPCGVMLNCGIHKCPSRCHQLHNHSKMACTSVVETRCTRGHVQKWKCHENKTAACLRCQREDEAFQRRLHDEIEEQARREKAEAEHAAELAKLDQDIRRIREEMADKRLEKEREIALIQKQKDLEAAIQQAQQNKIRADESTKKSANRVPVNSSSKHSRNSHDQPKKVPSDPKEKIDTPKTASELEWERQKKVDGSSNDAIDALMSLTGLEDVKAKVLSIKGKIETVTRQGSDMKNERLGLVLLGNPGTGKTTVARIYARFLASVGALPGSEFIETTGSRLANEGVAGTNKKIEQIEKAGGGVFFIDEAYQLADGQSPGGPAVCQFLLAEIENRRGKIVFVLAGYNKPMEKFFETNEGFDSRIPNRLHFADYTDKELMTMLRSSVEKRYNGNAKLEDGFCGLYARIAIRRLGRGRGREGYGNARALENLWAKISERQSDRLQRERASGASPDDFFFSKQDLIGPEPSEALQESAAWKELQDLIGLQAVKDAVRALIDRIQLNYERELAEKPPIEVSLNRVFLGSPGTGKTSVGKLYASMLADMGLLSKREVVIKNPSDFVGSVLGESEKNTKAILKATEGKVLMIDEAYMLHGSGKGPGNVSDPYRTAVVDTIVAEVQSTPGEDRCVLLLGYDDEMKEMLDNTNPGLARRFPLTSAFHFDDFDNTQLLQILDLKLAKQGLEATEEAKKVAIEVLAIKRDLPNFGNAGEVENMLSHAKEQEQKRRMTGSAVSPNGDILFLPQDFDGNFDRAKDSAVNCQRLFSDVVGCEDIIRQFQSYQEIATAMKAQDRDPRKHVPFTFIFKGPPGTGKTTTARKVGELYYNMGLLSTSDYEECSASDLIAPYVGQTGAKTVEALRKALGKVLFVDEAYRLCEGEFGHEAIGQLVDCLTKPQFQGKLVLILAGYSEDMNRLLKVNQGLSRRFPNEVVFRNMTPEECLTLLKMQLEREQIEVSLPSCDAQGYRDILDIFKDMSCMPSWGNGGDVTTLSERIGSAAILRGTTSVTEKDIVAALEEMLKTKKGRDKTGIELFNSSHGYHGVHTQQLNPATQIQVNQATSTATSTKIAEASPEPAIEHQEPSPTFGQSQQRDVGVSNDIWQQLQADIQANEQAEKQVSENIQKMEQSTQTLSEAEKAAEQETKATEEALELVLDNDEEDELRRRYEEARIKALAMYRAKQEAEEKLRLARLEQERHRKVEMEAQKKLQKMGVCVAGFRWIKQSGGYRCAGGSHFVSDAMLGV